MGTRDRSPTEAVRQALNRVHYLRGDQIGRDLADGGVASGTGPGVGREARAAAGVGSNRETGDSRPLFAGPSTVRSVGR